MKIKLSRTANSAARAIVRHVEKATGKELHFADCQAIMIHVQMAMNEKPTPPDVIKLTCSDCEGVTLTRAAKDSAALTSTIGRSEAPADEAYRNAVDGVESLLLAQHVAGVDLSTRASRKAYRTAMENLANKF